MTPPYPNITDGRNGSSSASTKKDWHISPIVPVNWCPALGTVLSNEEVKDGKYVDTGDPVKRCLMHQWMLKITAYAERLLEDLDLLDWPDGLKEMQRHWIGKSEGADITFNIKDNNDTFTAFTTRPDTLFGATYCVLAPEHPLVSEITHPDAAAEQLTLTLRSLSTNPIFNGQTSATEKTGVFYGCLCYQPLQQRAYPDLGCRLCADDIRHGCYYGCAGTR